MKFPLENLEKEFDKASLAALTLFLSVFFIYLPVIDGYYLHTDDYFWSYWGRFTCSGVVNWILPIGRPLAGLIYCFYPFVKDFRWVGIFRFISILDIGLAAFLLWKWMRKFNFSGLAACLVSLLIVTLPPFQVYASYISTVPHGMAVTASLFSLFCANRFAEEGKGLIPGILFLIAALCLNQASALFLVAGLALGILLTPSENFSKLWSKKLFRYALILMGAMLTYYVVFRISSSLFHFRDVGKYDGRNFVKDYRQRFLWFLAQPLYEASNLWWVNPDYLTQGIVVLLIGIVMLLEGLRAPDKKQWFFRFGILLLLIPTGYGISLVSSEPSTEYRTYAVIGSFFVFFLFVPLVKLFPKTSLPLLLCAAIMASVIANQNVTHYFVNCDSAEFRYVKNELRKHLNSGKKLDWIHMVTIGGPVAVKRQRNEIGEPTNRHTPNIEPLLLAALSELNVDLLPKITTSGRREDKEWVELVFDHNTIDLKQNFLPANPEEALVIDLSQLSFL